MNRLILIVGIMTSGLLLILILWGVPGSPKRAVVNEPPLERNKTAQDETSRTARIRTFAETWPKEPDYTFQFNALDPAGGARQAGPRASFDPSDDYWGLPRTPGFELVDAYCSACHTLEIVMQQAATPARWEDMLEWMVEEQGMAPIPEPDRAAVRDYLIANFGTSPH